MGPVIKYTEGPLNRGYAHLQYEFHVFLVMEYHMDKTYGPCWRCEGMGV